MISLRFVAGTVEIRDVPGSVALPAACRWDARSGCHRAPALAYADIVRALAGHELDDQARRYGKLDSGMRVRQSPRDYQDAALQAWRAARGRGVVVLPTGSGKTLVALLAIDDRRRSALVVAPTLDLVRQWYDILRSTFALEVGLVGGGAYDVKDLTVTTYDSAHLHVENLGARFGLVVFDECHHLPGEAYALAARLSIAPYRLGLTATPDRTDGREALLAELIGPIVYRRDIQDLAGQHLAAYDTVQLAVALGVDELAEYQVERQIYLDFLRSHGIRMGGPDGWSEFIMRSAGTEAGQRAMLGYRRQREIAFAAPAKLDYLEHLLGQHSRDRMLIFTQDNATVYRISRRFLVPAITHQTAVKERSQVLAGLAAGDYRAVVTSRVLNEGVDVPAANVAVVMSGSGTVREHVQRLGRILRPAPGKRAVLYELVSDGTAELDTSERRRAHGAYGN